MAKLLFVEAGDEISDVVDAVKRAATPEIALVLPPGSRAFQTPLNVRLLAQVVRTGEVTASIISEDPRIQQMARQGGFATFATIAAFERGVEMVRPATAPTGVAMATAALEDDGGPTTGAVATAVRPAPTPRPGTAAAGRVSPPSPQAGHRDRRPVYFAGVAVAVIGVLLFLFVAPSAMITITVAATHLSVNPVIQGSTDPTSAQQPDHVVTAVASDTETGGFKANPTGSKQLPATASSGSIRLQWDVQQQKVVTLPKNVIFDTDPGGIQFAVTTTTTVTLAASPNGTDYGAWSDPVPVQAMTTGASTNVAADTKWTWDSNPCGSGSNQISGCTSGDFHIVNAQAMNGGADPKTVTTASASDVQAFTTQVKTIEGQLTPKMQASIATKTNGKVVAKDPAGGGDQAQCTVTPALPNPDDQFTATQIAISCTETAAVYSVDDVHKALVADLQGQVAQGDSLDMSQIRFGDIKITQADTTGIVIASASATAYSRPTVDFQSMRSQFTGKSVADVTSMIQHHGANVPRVDIRQSPITLPNLPLFASRITVVVVYR